MSGRANRDADRLVRLERTIRECMRSGAIPVVPTRRTERAGIEGAQSRLAEHFGVSRQRVSQLVARIRQEHI